MKNSFSYSIHGMIWLMDSMANQLLKEKYDITFRKFYVLAVLSSCQPTTQANLADYLGQSTAAVSKSLTILEAEGLVTITVNPDHKRHNVVQLTKQGAQLTQEASMYLEELLQQHFAETGVNLQQYTKDTVTLRNRLEQVASSTYKK
jgi:DNA-binding MarR family transcriptional regulator